MIKGVRRLWKVEQLGPRCTLGITFIPLQWLQRNMGNPYGSDHFVVAV